MEKNCASCGGCRGNCGGCGGCGSSLLLTPGEIALLKVLEQVPFLPVARRADSEEGVCMEKEVEKIENISATLALLEKKALIDLDYRAELKGFDYAAYAPYSCRGTMALTARGQQVLELMDIQGVGE